MAVKPPKLVLAFSYLPERRSVRKCIFLFISLPQIGAANANRKDNRDRRDL
jgi:hypothetical protein